MKNISFSVLKYEKQVNNTCANNMALRALKSVIVFEGSQLFQRVIE